MTHDERTDRRLAAVLALTREENCRRPWSHVTASESTAWALAIDPDVHTVNTCNVRQMMRGGADA